jgi:protein-S-isoprenylcysteine O-methyltransferase Ste14
MEIRVRERTVDLTLGYSSLVLFGVSIVVLIWFLLPGIDRVAEGEARTTWNTLLLLAWGFVHSLMARPRFKTQLQKVLRPHLQSSVYALVASASLILVCFLYRPMPRTIYHLDGGAALLVRLIFLGAWALFVHCFMHLDLYEIVGLRPILHYMKSEPRVPQPFHPTGPFTWVRHPVELAFLVAFWAAPEMSAGHLLFATVMTIYTILGIDLEDRKMLDLYGGTYLEYMKRVPQLIPLPR